MEIVERIETVVRQLMDRPAAIGLPPAFDFALLIRDLTGEIRRVSDVELGVKALRVAGRTATGSFRIEFPPMAEGDRIVIACLYGRIEDGRISRMWRSLHSPLGWVPSEQRLAGELSKIG